MTGRRRFMASLFFTAPCNRRQNPASYQAGWIGSGWGGSFEPTTSLFPVSTRKEITSMKKFSGIAAACLLTLAGVAFAAEELKSGLPVGEGPVPAFNVRDITGPKKGETLCY